MIRFLSAAATLVAAFTLSLTSARAVDDVWDYSVQVSSAVQASPAKITLAWPQDTNGTPSSYTIYRRLPTDASWGSGTTLPGSTTTYTDTSVSVGTAYEYRIVKASIRGYTGYGYIETGINVPLVDNRGKVILIVDKTMSGPLSSELARLQQDLVGDGWTVIRHDVNRTDSVPSVKALIKGDYNADPSHVKSVFLFGHIPVPYSGQLNPDGHPDHVGAWPADAFYGDMTGTWTDSTVNYTQNVNTDPADAARLTNKPGDGKYDQSDLPANVTLQVGRVDLANMPGRETWGGPATFPSETELLRKYLNKDHAFRTRAVNPPRRAILGDYFGARGGEAFAASGFRSFAPLVGADKIRNLNTEFTDQKGVWIPQTSANDYLLAYACGAGSYDAVSGIGSTGTYYMGTTVEMVKKNVHGTFNLIFGSWLGDWDHEDDMLRSPLATDYGLVSVWSGRPHWFLHPMGLGETIGYVTKLTQNNVKTYETTINTAAHRIHIALMGDPTLRLHSVVPVGALKGAASGSSVSLSWSASTDSAIVGYHVYRATSANGTYTRLTSSPIAGTSYTDAMAPNGATYMVRAIKLESTPSGSYYNGSEGVFWSAATGSTGGSDTGTTAPASDSTAPTISLSAPASGATVSGSSVTVTANATDNVGVTGVQFKLDGANFGSEDTASPFSTTLNTTTLTNGSHTLGAVARDAAGNMASAVTLTINVSNAVVSGGSSSGSGGTSTSTSSTGSSGSTTSTSSVGPTSPNGSTDGMTIWIDDALPAGAGGLSGTGDTWNWVTSNPTPISGTKAHRSDVASGRHEHWFSWSNKNLVVNQGDVLFTYVYLDPANPPSEIMVSWHTNGNWNHRAYWGTDILKAGTGAAYVPMGALPATGQWVRLEVPASKLGLDGATVTSMMFTCYNGGATWDAAGTMLPDAPELNVSGTASGSGTGTSSGSGLPVVSVVATDPYANIRDASDTGLLTFTRTGSTAAALTVNFTLGGTAGKWDDYYRTPQGDMPVSITIPAGAASATMGIVGRNNINNANPETATFTVSSNSAYTVGSQNVATLNLVTTSVSVSGTPTTGSTSGSTSSGSTSTTTPSTGGTSSGTTSGSTSSGTTSTSTPSTVVSGGTTSGTSSTSTSTTSTGGTSGTITSDETWFEDALPTGAGMVTKGGDTWNWVSGSPTAFAGSKAHQSAIAAGLHEHSFAWVTTPQTIATGDKLYTYVYLDPANMPQEVMLSWYDGTTWNHRGYWGANKINYSTDGTAAQLNIGALPAGGKWVRLEVPAKAVNLEGMSVKGMSFTLYGGRATFDHTGKTTTTAAPSSGSTAGSTDTTSSGLPVVSVAATDAYANINDKTDTGTLTFTRTGSTASDLTVNYVLGGTAGKWNDYYRTPQGDMPISVTIPAGASSATMTIIGRDNINNANPETATFTLKADPAYSVGTGSTTTLNLVTTSVISGGTSSGGTSSGSTTTSGGTTSGGTTSGGTTSGSTTTSGTSTGSTGPIATVANVLQSDAATLAIPNVGDYALHVISPTVLELERVTTQAQSATAPTDWNFVDGSGNFTAPATSKFTVSVGGKTVAVSSVGFRRRVLSGEFKTYDLRIDNWLYLTLASPIADGQSIQVANPDGSLWPASMQFKAVADTLRYSPAIHVNQEGYVPSLPKKAMVGYYLGNAGELSVDPSVGFKLVNASTGVTVYTGSLTARPDTGWIYSPAPYQKVLQADFSSFTTPGLYKLVVPGLGASLPFLIDNGIAMAFARTYELGLYEQRCGGSNELPYTRFTKNACHTAPAEIPTADSQYAYTWKTITADSAGNSSQTAPQLTSVATQLYPFVNQGKVDVSGGHHDAGDYSKYTINVALLTHQLMFTADSIKGAAALDNLGIPESGDGISDIMQEAKWEADYLAKLQDADGGFYFIVYPKNRSYEYDVSPDHGDTQVVWPKNTSATASAVAALAQCASSPLFKKTYPDVAASYLAKAKLGWQFLMNAQAKYGKAGAYQKVTFYGDQFNDNDELAWAAASMYAATGDTQYRDKLMAWFPDPNATSTILWGWWRLYQGYGAAIRTYAFAARSGRLSASQLDPTYLAACENQIKLAGDDQLKWANQSAYGTSFPENTKHALSAGWYFSNDQASDMAVAYQLNPKPEYIDALLTNMNYEAGANAVNISYLAGLGQRRKRHMVSQYALNQRRLLPPDGEPAGNIMGSYGWMALYGSALSGLSYPSDSSKTSPYAFYDRYSDIWNVTTEFVTPNQARSLTAVAFLAAQTSAASTAWKPSATATIVAPLSATVGKPVTLSLGSVPSLTNARIVWEGSNQQPAYGNTFTMTPTTSGAQWVEVEIEWPDGRRMFGSAAFTAN